MNPPEGGPRRMLLPLGLLFLVSGAAGLVYEVLWSRQLARVLGGSYPAVVAVVTVFLGGLALGAALGGRFAPRLRRPLHAYAILEAGIGIYCLAFPAILAALSPAFGWCYRAFEGNPGLHFAARFLVAAVALLPPTIAMGATLPVLVRVAVREDGSVLAGAGVLYGLNTLGAAGGAWLAGFVLLPNLGFRGTLHAGVMANLAVAVVAMVLDRFAGEAPPGRRDDGVSPVPVPRLLLLVAAGSGFTGMLYQLGWTRALVLCFGSSVHAFTLVLAVFILGLGAGGLLAPLLERTGRHRLLVLAILEAVVGLGGWWSAARIPQIPLEVALFTGGAPGPGYTALLWFEGSQALVLALLPTLAMGMLFPLLVAALAPDPEDAARATGRAYAANTAGVILGSLGGGLLLIPAIGTRGAVVVAFSLNFLLAAALAVRALPRPWCLAGGGALLAAGGALAATAPEWPPWRMNSGPFLYGDELLPEGRADAAGVERVMRDGGWDMPFATEGRSSSVAVFHNPDGSQFLRVNGKTDASTYEDRVTQMLLGHLPVLAHPAPKSALVVGLASGMTTAAIASHGIRTDVAEISAEVREAYRLFEPWNGAVLDRPNVRLLLEDGRTVIEHGGGSYDLIASEPTNPWIAGVSDLFTVEYFEACRQRLAPGGVACVWLQSYNLSLEHFRMVVRTFRSVFPDATVWEMAPACDYALLGTKEGDADLPRAVAGRAWPAGEGGAHLAAAGIPGREAALSLLFLDRKETAAFAAEGDGELHTDDRLQLEFQAPAGTFREAGYVTLPYWERDRLLGTSAPPEVPGFDGRRLERLRWARAVAIFGARAADGEARQALLDPRRKSAAAIVAELRPGMPAALHPLLEEWAQAPREEPPGAIREWLVRGVAVARLEQSLAGGLAETWVTHVLAAALLDRGDLLRQAGEPAAAAADYRRAREVQPWNALLPVRLSLLEIQPEAALRLVDEAIVLHPHCEEALRRRIEILRAMGRKDEAARAVEHLLRVRPDASLPR